MHVKRIAVAMFSAGAVLVAGTPVLAQQQDKPAAGMMGGGMGGMMGGGGSMTGGGMPMMDMMQGCQRMMGAGMRMPQLPAGNEKLQLQMQAEMMQKMGEILAKYAAQVTDARGAAR